MNRRFRIPAIALCAIGLLAASCSSNTKSSSSTSGPTTTAGLVANVGNAGGGSLADAAATSPLTGPAGSGLTRGVTATSITVGCVYTSSAFAGYQEGIQARFDRANKAGGVDGRKLTLLPCADDGGAVQTDVQDVQQQVNQGNAFALLSATESILPGSTDFLNNNQVPFFGWGFLPGFCGLRWGFGWNGCLEGNAVTKAQVAHAAIQGNLAEAILKATHMKPSQVRLAIQGESSAAGKIGNAQYHALFTKLGAKVVYDQANMPETAAGADLTPYVQAIMATKPNLVYVSTFFSDVGPLVAGLRAAGFTGATMDFISYIPGLLQSSPQLASALQGEYVNTQVVPQEQNTPWIAQIEADLTASGQKPFVTLGGSMGYTEAEELIEMLQAVGPNLNTKTFDQVVNHGHFVSYADIPSGGPGKLQWPAAHLLPADCAAIVQVKGDAFNVVQPFACYQSYKLF